MPPVRFAKKRSFNGSKRRTDFRARGHQATTATLQAARGIVARAANQRTGGFVDIENKFLDSELTSTALAATWTSLNPSGTGCTDSISVPAQGDGESERDGRVFYINSVHVNGFFQIPAAESAVAPPRVTFVRVILYWDTQTNAAEATATDIMDGGGSVDVLGFRNLQNSKRFIVLKDKLMKITPMSTNEGAVNLFATGVQQIHFKFNKKFAKPIKVRTSGTTANVNVCTDNNLGIAALCDVTTQAPTIQYQARVRFSG